MRGNVCRQLADFLKEQGNCLEFQVRPGDRNTCEKEYDYRGGDGRKVKGPRWFIGIDACAAERAVEVLGVRTVRVRGGTLLILRADVVSVLPGGWPIVAFHGIRTGVSQLQGEKGFVVRLMDGGLLQAATERGVRSMLAAAPRDQAASVVGSSEADSD